MIADGTNAVVAVRKKAEGASVNGILFERFPDGSELDYNRIYDAVDKVLAIGKKKPDPLRDAKRYMFQYRDTQRNLEIIQDRYDLLSAPLSCDEQRFIRNPAGRLDVAAKNARERPAVCKLLYRAEKECNEAKTRVALAIRRLGNDVQKLVITAHFVCGADLKWISTVYGHKSYWAKDVCDKALAIINPHISEEIAGGSFTDAITELEMQIRKWEKDDAEFREKLAAEVPHEPLDDRKMILGLL